MSRENLVVTREITHLPKQKQKQERFRLPRSITSNKLDCKLDRNFYQEKRKKKLIKPKHKPDNLPVTLVVYALLSVT